MRFLKRLTLTLLWGLLTGWGSWAQTGQASLFDGTWKVDLKSEKYISKPIEILLKDGEYSCRSCTPPYTIKADGKDHKVSVSPYFDTENITIVDQRTLSRIDKQRWRTSRNP
jgi:hypothetical protein